MMIPIVFGLLGTVPNGSVKKLEYLQIRGPSREQHSED